MKHTAHIFLLFIILLLFLCGCSNTDTGIDIISPSPKMRVVTPATKEPAATVSTFAPQTAENIVQQTPSPSNKATLIETIIPPSPTVSLSPIGGVTAPYNAIPLPDEMRAMWISFLEWQDVDFSSAEAFTNEIGQMFDNCANMGLNTVIVSVRPFSDALYKSQIYPWSHLLTGVQGQDPGYDPLAIMTEEAHRRGLRIEAWINPYRVQHPTYGPSTLSSLSPGVLYADKLRKHEGLWMDPGYPEVSAMIANGAAEIVENYEVDGIHFDDYFYPEGISDTFDSASYSAYGNGANLAEWRRANIDNMVKKTYAAVKGANPTVSFGISPQGNNDNNYNMQYCDIAKFMSNPGYLDYVMPQLYWGFNYSRKGNTKASFENKVKEWSSYAKTDGVRLYAGLGAYRIGDGDGSDLKSDEWKNGATLTEMVKYIQQPTNSVNGFAIFNYKSLFPGEYPDLASAEVFALTKLLTNNS